jgi:hypothetical protein
MADKKEEKKTTAEHKLSALDEGIIKEKLRVSAVVTEAIQNPPKPKEKKTESSTG